MILKMFFDEQIKKLNFNIEENLDERIDMLKV